MVKIYVPDMNDSVGKITLDGKNYNIRFTYNASGDYWSFGLYTVDMDPILPMTKIVPDFLMLFPYRYTDLPEGQFYCYTQKDSVGRRDFADDQAYFMYLQNEEISAQLD